MSNKRSLRTCCTPYVVGWVISTLLGCASPANAESPSIEYVESPAIQRGTDATLKMFGANLQDTRDVVFYEPGLICQAIRAEGDDGLLLQLQASRDCAIGMHAFRVRTDGGFSELRTLAVTQFPVVRDESPTPELAVGRSVVGRLRDDQTNRYLVALNAGQRLSIDVEAMRLGVDMIDVAVVLRDPEGMVVAQADDSPLYRQDPILSIVAKIEGKYSIEVHDAGRNAGEHACYLLHISDGPRPLSVFPLGGRPGTEIQLTYSGDVRGSFTDIVQLPLLETARNSTFQLLAEQDGKYSATALPFRLADLANINEAGDNDSFNERSTAGRIEVPVAINARIDQPLDRDCFWINAVAGQRLNAEVYAQRLGSAADTLLTVVDSAQKRLVNSDDIDSLDSRAEFTVPQDGKFGILVQEKQGKGGQGFAYRIEIVPARPTAEVFLPRRDRLSQEMQAVSIPAGNRVLALLAVRKDDATGEVLLRFPELPEGITAHWTQPRDDQAIVPVVFEASRMVGTQGKTMPVEVTVHSPEHTAVGQFRQVTDLVKGPADAIYTEYATNRLAIGTREEYPIQVKLAQPKATLMQDGTLDIRVSVERKSGYQGDIHVTLPWLPPWVDAEPNVLIPADRSEATIRLRAWVEAETAKWPLVVEGAADTTSRRNRVRKGGPPGGDAPPPAALYPQAIASLPVELNISPSPAVARFEDAAAEQGQVINVTCLLTTTDQLQSISELVATLEGLPNRVVCDPVPIQAVDQTIAFKVNVDRTAPVGRFSGLACRISGKMFGEEVSCVVSREGSITIAPPGEVVRDENGQPLNRIDALRKKFQSTKK